MHELNVILVEDMDTVGHIRINVEVREHHGRSCLFFNPCIIHRVSQILELLSQGECQGKLLMLDGIPGGFPKRYAPDIPEHLDFDTYGDVRAYVLPDELLDLICWELFNKPPRDSEKMLQEGNII